MKLRIRGNSIRLRLMQSEVKLLQEDGIVEEHVHFPGGQVMSYSVQKDARFDASVMDQSIKVCVPEDLMSEWIDSEELSLKSSLELPNGEALSVLVEKDLACSVQREGEDDSDAYPNPLYASE